MSPGRRNIEEDIATVKMKVLDVWKGSLQTDTLSFTMARTWALHYPWFAPVPWLGVGEEWIVHLKRYPDGLHPYGGKNGMFKVEEGGRLLYAGKIPIKMGIEEMKAKLEQAAGE